MGTNRGSERSAQAQSSHVLEELSVEEGGPTSRLADQNFALNEEVPES